MAHQAIGGIWLASTLDFSSSTALLSLRTAPSPSTKTALELCFKHEILPILPIIPVKHIYRMFSQSQVTAVSDPVFDLIISVGLFYLGELQHQKGDKIYVPRFIANNIKDIIRCYLLEAVFQGFQHLHVTATTKCQEAEKLLLALPISSYQNDSELCMLFWSNAILIKYEIFLKYIYLR